MLSEWVTIISLLLRFADSVKIPDGSFDVKYELETGGDLENKKEYCDGNHWYINYLNLEVDKDGHDKVIDEYFIVINSKVKWYTQKERIIIYEI